MSSGGRNSPSPTKPSDVLSEVQISRVPKSPIRPSPSTSNPVTPIHVSSNFRQNRYWAKPCNVSSLTEVTSKPTQSSPVGISPRSTLTSCSENIELSESTIVSSVQESPPRSTQKKLDVCPVRFKITPFDGNLDEIKKQLTNPINPELYGEVEDNERELVEKHLKGFIAHHIKLYEDPKERIPHVENALTFFTAFLSGRFLNHLDDIIVVTGDTFQVWSYEPSRQGESAVLEALMNEEHGAFANPGMGYWKSNYIFKARRPDPLNRGMGTVMRLLVFSLEDAAYEVYPPLLQLTHQLDKCRNDSRGS